MNIKPLSLAVILGLASTAVFAQEEEEKKPFTMDGEFGLIVTSGNTETTSVVAGINATQELEKWTNVYLVEALFKSQKTTNEDGQESDDTVEQRVFASAQGNYQLANPNHRLFVFGSYEDDRFGNFKYQGTLAAGWNHLVWEDDKSSFDYSIGPGYSFAEDLEGNDVSEAIIRAALNYNWNVSETARFSQTFSTEYGSDNIKSRAESALTASLAGGLSLKLSVQFNHNSDVAPGFENLDTQVAATLVYSFF